MIRRVEAAAVRPLRLAVLRAGEPPEAAVWPGDDDAVHLAAFAGDRVVGVVTVLPSGQLRGMATAPDVRGAGYGAALLRAAEESGATWCNARLSAAGFYERHGWRRTGDVFVTAETGLPHVRMLCCERAGDRPGPDVH